MFSFHRDEPFESHTSGNPPEDESQGGNEDDENDVTTVYSDAESESLLLPVEICLESQSLSVTSYDFSTQTESFIIKSEDKGSSPEQSPVHTPAPQTTEPSVPQQRSAAPFPSADRFESRSVTCSPPCTSSTVSPSPPRPFPPSPRALPLPDPGPSIDSASFWKSCNTAGCTEAIFSGFITEIYEICGRIQSDQASKEDYDHALAVMAASGKLAALVTTQQKELQRKQMELEKAAAAMTEVASALKR
uniref:uncharacterized protein n=1 Tax=Semicossyphus pulcher TaxID=241346 RepID=UPI0037E757B8